jgi:ABC-type sugar transport system ATPase subunit
MNKIVSYGGEEWHVERQMKEITFLDIQNITKNFGVVEALKSVSFPVKKGEIHTILGENGAGKSTLVKIINGEVKPDSGNLSFDGKQIHVRDPKHARSLGISMVHQELSIFENLYVAENIFPNSTYRSLLGFIDKKELFRKAKEKIALFGLDIDPKEKLINLSLAEQQIVEILRSISLDPKLIILDEPTSGLKRTEVRNLFAILRKLKEQGITILYISHRIPEILEISDRVTVLKDGSYVDTVEKEGITEKRLITLMVGREIDTLYGKKTYVSKAKGGAFLELESIGKSNSIHDVSLKVRYNEIIGVFGLEGSGTNELSRIMFGLESFDEGVFRLEGKQMEKVTPADLLKKGVVYLSRNRKEAGLFFDMTASENMGCPVLERYARFNFLDYGKLQEFTESFIRTFGIVIPSVRTKPKNLSGGNQQKLMLSICMGTDPKCIIINEPTRGIDVGAKAEIHRMIRGLVESETSVVMISSELPELMSLCDRVVVMRNMTVVGELSGERINEETIMTYAAGGKK